MGWLHSAPSQQAQPVAAASSGIPFGVRNGSGKSARSISSYGNYSTAGYPSMAATAENVALASIGRCAENAAVAYGMAPPLTTIPLPLPQSPSTSSASSSPHDYNHNHNHSHSHSHSHSHNHHRNPYAYMVAANMSPQQSSSLYMAHAEYPPMTANSNRMMRNLAEKMRRDKLNTYIGELSTLVPMVSNSPKKMDKTSVLRLATTFLRMHRVTEATRDQRNMLPHIFNSSEWPQSLLDKMDGVMLIVTSAGKIVFISHNIEKVLGHTQTELMGHGLSNITFPPDLPELRRCLTPDKEDENCSDNVGANTNTNTNNTNANANANTNTNTNNCTLVERQRRSVCLRLRHRCLARSEQPQYEPMHLNGFLRVPKKYTCQAQKKSRKCKGEMVATNSNEILLVAVMKPAREMTLMSIVEASQEEYVTRHWYDGRIIFCDQRISLVSGYLPDEVKGLQAFLFMAKEEVHWVMIALRQMLWNREGFGKSCYRLKRKNGEFIYLVTHGYLEPCEDLHKSTFVCVNTLVSSEEGEREIRNMKRKFTPIIERKEEPAIAAIAEKYTFVNLQDRRNEDDYTPSTEDPAELKTALKAMVTNIPAPVEVKEDPDKCRDTQFAKVKYISKTLPPPTIPGSKLITVVEEKTATTTTMTTMTTMTALTTSSMSPSPSSPSSSPSLSPSPSTSFSSKLDRLSPSLTNVATSTAAATTIIGGASSPQPHAMAVSPSATASSRTAFQNRPSVLRIAPARQAAVNASPVTASTDSYSISSTSNFDSEAVAIGDIAPRKYSASFSRAAEYAVQPSPSNCDFVKQECRIKQETIDVDDGDGDDDDDDDDDNEEEQENNGGNNNDEDDDDDDDLEAQFAAAMQADSCQQLAAAVAAAAATVAANAVENERAGVVVSGRSAVKRHLHCDGSSFGSSVVPIKKNANFADGANNHQHQQNYGLATAIAPSLSPHQVSSSSSASALSSSYAVHRNNAQYSTATVSALNSSNLHLETTDVSQMDDSYTQLAGIEMCDPTSRFVHDITNSFEAKGKPEDVLQLLDNENLKHHHIELESKMHIQGAQINAIEGDLNKVPFTSEQLGFQTDLTHLKEQHVKQKKLLMTLQQDHHSLQHCNAPDAMGISSTLHQNVGV